MLPLPSVAPLCQLRMRNAHRASSQGIDNAHFFSVVSIFRGFVAQPHVYSAQRRISELKGLDKLLRTQQ